MIVEMTEIEQTKTIAAHREVNNLLQRLIDDDDIRVQVLKMWMFRTGLAMLCPIYEDIKTAEGREAFMEDIQKMIVGYVEYKKSDQSED